MCLCVQVRIYELGQLSLKVERHFDAEIVDFQVSPSAQATFPVMHGILSAPQSSPNPKLLLGWLQRGLSSSWEASPWPVHGALAALQSSHQSAQTMRAALAADSHR